MQLELPLVLPAEDLKVAMDWEFADLFDLPLNLLLPFNLVNSSWKDYSFCKSFCYQFIIIIIIFKMMASLHCVILSFWLMGQRTYLNLMVSQSFIVMEKNNSLCSWMMFINCLKRFLFLIYGLPSNGICFTVYIKVIEETKTTFSSSWEIMPSIFTGWDQYSYQYFLFLMLIRNLTHIASSHWLRKPHQQSSGVNNNFFRSLE